MSRKDIGKPATAPEADVAPKATVAATEPEEVPMAVMKAEEPAKVAPPAATVPPAKAKAKTRGHTLCRITGTNVIYRGKLVEVDTVDEFSDDVVLQMPDVFVSLE